jgi:hypothetical protein
MFQMEKGLQQADSDRAGALAVAVGERQRDEARDGCPRAQGEGWKRGDQRHHSRSKPAVTVAAREVKSIVSGDVQTVQE